MGTEIPDILHNDFHVAYKYFTCQRIANGLDLPSWNEFCINRKMRDCAKGQ